MREGLKRPVAFQPLSQPFHLDATHWFEKKVRNKGLQKGFLGVSVTYLSLYVLSRGLELVIQLDEVTDELLLAREREQLLLPVLHLTRRVVNSKQYDIVSPNNDDTSPSCAMKWSSVRL